MRITKKHIAASLMVTGFLLPHIVSAASDGAAIFGEACTGCHNASSRPLDNVHLTKAQWKETVEQMASLGAEVPSGKKLELLFDYLVSTYGPSDAVKK